MSNLYIKRSSYTFHPIPYHIKKYFLQILKFLKHERFHDLCAKFSNLNTGTTVAVGTKKGTVNCLDSHAMKSLLNEPFKYSKGAVKQIIFDSKVNSNL